MSRPAVLVVEDESAMLDIIDVNLKQAGYDVTLAQDGIEAYRSLENRKPDVVVLDLNLPNMSGFRLLRLMRREPALKSIPLIVVTAFAFEEVEEIANEGIDGFMTKPFDPSDLVGKIEYLLSRGSQVALP